MGLERENDATYIERRHFTEEVGMFFEESGAPRMMGRILGWLLICDPPEQSAKELAEVLDASRGSVSTMTRMLIAGQMVEKVVRRGERQTHFRLRRDAFTQAVHGKLAHMFLFREIAERGLHILEVHGLRADGRLQEARDFYAFMERELPALIDKWDREFDRKHRGETS